ncbi:MAG: FixH family protein [Alphaproteobacteria bacterium]|nr:FixH family protein [Rhodospirillales bacterium]MCW9045513.1 FixH family protein [Alphaproteobacteria bacterium]
MMIAFMVVVVGINFTVVKYATGTKDIEMVPDPVFYSEGKQGDSYKGRLRLSYKTKSGKVLKGMRIIAVFALPSRNNLTFEHRVPKIDDGVYETSVDFPYPGQWEVRLYASKGLANSESIMDLDVK